MTRPAARTFGIAAVHEQMNFGNHEIMKSLNREIMHEAVGALTSPLHEFLPWTAPIHERMNFGNYEIMDSSVHEFMNKAVNL
jgi:hypothetical protein